MPGRGGDNNEAYYLSEIKRLQRIIDDPKTKATILFAAQKKYLNYQIKLQNLYITGWEEDISKEWTSFALYCRGNLTTNTYEGLNEFWVTVPARWTPPYEANDFKDETIRDPYTESLGIDPDDVYDYSPLTYWGQHVATIFNTHQTTSKSLVDGWKEKISDANLKINNFQGLIDDLDNAAAPFDPEKFDKLENGTVSSGEESEATLVYNCSYPKETYFASNQFLYYTDSQRNTYQVMHGNNAPTKITSDPRTELFRNGFPVKGHKGMIIPNSNYFKSTKQTNNSTNVILPQDKNKNTIDTFSNNVSYNNRATGNFGFQFMYNPGSIEMSYMGTPDVDVGFEISGSEQFGLIGGIGVTQSTITFDILINRMFDMKYIDPKTKTLKKGYKITDVYPAGSNLPTDLDLELIYRRGTMYDIEFLLRGLLGYAAVTTLRSFVNSKGISNNRTADIGYLGAMPVELHLGDGLRYLGIINGLGIRHVMFNERMVPTFTTMRIQFNRIPDFPNTV